MDCWQRALDPNLQAREECVTAIFTNSCRADVKSVGDLDQPIRLGCEHMHKIQKLDGDLWH